MTIDLSEAEGRLTHLALGALLPSLSEIDRRIALRVQGRIDVGITSDSAELDNADEGKA